MLVLSQSDVRSLLDIDGLVDELAEAMSDLSAGNASVPPRTIARVDEQDGILAAMSAYLPSARTLATKLVSVFPRNHGTLLPTHQAVIVVFDAGSGEPVALLDATYITAARTAAGSALATRLLAREDAEVLAVIGTGVQARAHLEAIPRMRTFREIRVVGRDPAKARALADELGATVAKTVEGADVVCACTHAAEPVVRRTELSDGVHVTSVGVNLAGREVDEDTIRDAHVVVESRAAAMGGAAAAGAPELAGVAAGEVTEIGEIISGARPGRTSGAQITLYKSVGVAVQDAAAAWLVLQAAAREPGVGTVVPL